MTRTLWLIAALAFTCNPAAAQGFRADLLQPPKEVPGLQTGEILVADLDVDGRPDLLTSRDAQPFDLRMHLQGAEGSFDAGVPILFEVPVGPDFVKVADLDADGWPDIVGCYGYFVRVRRGTGGGDFGPVQASSASPYPSAFAVGDFDGDGAPDALVGSKPQGLGGLLELARGHADGTFGAFQAVATPRWPVQLEPADLDADGDLDVACVEGGLLGFGGGYLGSLLNTGDATLIKLPKVLDIGFPARITSPVDFDGDGLPDFVAWEQQVTDGVVDVDLLSGKGDGDFASHDLLTPPGHARDLRCADLDSDGFLDIVMDRNFGGGPTISDLFAQRLVRFGPEGDPLSVPQLEGTNMAVADLGGDGLPETVTFVMTDPQGSDEASLLIYGNGIGPIADLGLGAPGGPALSADGVPAAGQPLHLAWAGSGVIALAVGLEAEPHALSSGFLVPVPTFVLVLPAPGALDATWPAGVPVGTHVYVQGVQLGSGGPQPGNALLLVAQA
ncbi:MAG TPA: VCBS repeat-containing protein [Planctomycetota bacterium]|nr:VCBS repeat-containing protein [Planctomycetota bacterium]